eukprot:CAMPEP_0173396032 /NCGR_PEP_ID=MMETSP1356-20130122/34241_1 /TAXON_ID=77927 ORGANISM="Hemiselmis virescens, Strain PCC157" /NCGR_SAMPLE_ID=MMETSP1356 /ASSEMBLY_ACC=CAM_ASM_000847 /LENGTH=85 /DNA_ID=CAMNT_0014354947 /DNA_START=301 /DNA_END=559 /DNA_ORIENTATION=-
MPKPRKLPDALGGGGETEVPNAAETMRGYTPTPVRETDDNVFSPTYRDALAGRASPNSASWLLELRPCSSTVALMLFLTSSSMMV